MPDVQTPEISSLEEFDSFEEFYETLESQTNLAENIARVPDELGEKMKHCFRDLYTRAQADGEFRRQLADNPDEVIKSFVIDEVEDEQFGREVAEAELSGDELELVAGGCDDHDDGGAPDEDSDLGNDIGYVIGSAAEEVASWF